MPWTAASFKAKHWNACTPGQCRYAARKANQILAAGGSEGVAIATGIAKAKRVGAKGPAAKGRAAKSRNYRVEALGPRR